VLEFLLRPWPWYVAGPLIGLFVPALLWIGNKPFGISSSLRDMCASVAPGSVEYFRYDWKQRGAWNLAFAAGILAGGFVATFVLGGHEVAIATEAKEAIARLGVREFAGLVPGDVFNWRHLLTVRGAILMLGGGFLVGFGTAYAGGCTSGHGIAGLAVFDRASLVAVLAFFAGGLVATYLLLPVLL
jgi:uncharacterized membrane protein YedE/YeeE